MDDKLVLCSLKSDFAILKEWCTNKACHMSSCPIGSFCRIIKSIPEEWNIEEIEAGMQKIKEEMEKELIK